MIKKYAPWALLFITILVFLYLDSCSRQKANRELAAAKGEATYWKDQFGNEHVRLSETILALKDMRKEVDSIAKVLKIKPKTITRYIKTNLGIDTVLVGTVDTVYQKDTITKKVDTLYELDYRDSNFISVHARVPTKPQYIKIGVNADLAITDFYKRRKILGLRIGKKDGYTDIGTNNPYIKISNAESIRKQLTPKLRLKTGFGIGATYDPFTRSIHPGIQIGVYLIRSR